MPDTPVGTDSPDYTLVTADLGATVYCKVTATNSVGSANANSNVVGPVAPAGVAPSITVPPTVTVAGDGASVTCSTGTWANTPTGYAYQWYSDETPDVAISGAISATYVIDGGVIEEGGAGFIYLADTEGQGDDSIITSAIDTTGAGLLIVVIADYTTTNTVSDSKGNTWSGVPTSVGNSARIFYSWPTTVGTGHTITISNATPPLYSSACFVAFSGGSGGEFDADIITITGTGATATAGGITPVQNNSLIISAVNIMDTGGGSSSVGGGFTKICDLPRIGQFGLTVGYLIQTTAAAVNPSWSVAGMNSWDAVSAVFSSVPLALTRPA